MTKASLGVVPVAIVLGSTSHQYMMSAHTAGVSGCLETERIKSQGHNAVIAQYCRTAAAERLACWPCTLDRTEAADLMNDNKQPLLAAGMRRRSAAICRQHSTWASRQKLYKWVITNGSLHMLCRLPCKEPPDN
jgi:hypothetical protein